MTSIGAWEGARWGIDLSCHTCIVTRERGIFRFKVQRVANYLGASDRSVEVEVASIT